MNGEDDQLPVPDDSVLRLPADQIESLDQTEESPVSQSDSEGWNSVQGSVFANHRDLERYQMARMNGASEEDALKVGDSGQGKWGKITATYKTPYVALPYGTPGAGKDTPIEIQGPNGKIVRATVADVMSNKVAAKIDMNPATAMAVGAKDGLTPVKWRFAGTPKTTSSLSLGAPLPPLPFDMPQPEANKLPGTYEPQGSGNLGPAIGESAPVSAQAAPESSGVPVAENEAQTQEQEGVQTTYSPINAEALNPTGVRKVKDNDDGSYTLSNGITIYPDLSIVYKRGDNLIWEDAFGRTQKVGTVKPTKTYEQIAAEEAAKKGVIRSRFPQGPEGDQDYIKAQQDVLQASRAGVGVDPEVIADAIVDGRRPPLLTGLYGRSGAVQTSLFKKHPDFNLANAQLDFMTTQKFMSSMNSAQQLRLRQNLDFAETSLGLIDDLNKQWKAGQFPILNKVRLESAKQGLLGKDAQEIATRLDAQINDFVAESGNIYMGGNSPTDHALQLAAANMKSNWSEGTLDAMIDQAKTNMKYRSNSIRNSVPAGTQGENPYFTPQGQASPSATPTVSRADKTPPSTGDAIAEARRRLAIDPKDKKALDTLQTAKDLGLLK